MKSVLIFSGYNQRAIIAFCRYALENNIVFGIVAHGEVDSIYHTDYRKFIISQRDKLVLDLQDVLNYASELKSLYQNKDVFILPSTEYLNRLLLSWFNVLLLNNISFGLCDKDVYELISDKYAFSYLCKNNGLNVPEEFVTPPNSYPFVIKPKKYIGVNNTIASPPILVYSESDLEKALSHININDYFFQEFIPGRNYYLLYYFDKEGNYSVYSQENLIQQADGKSMILSKSSMIHLDEISHSYGRLIKSLNFQGLIMIDLKKHNNNYFLIEANPRLWGPSQLILDSGMNLFDHFSLDNHLLTKIDKKEYKEDIFYFWSSGMIDNLLENKSFIYHDYNSELFINSYSQLITKDIYCRHDTIDLYLNSLKKSK